MTGTLILTVYNLQFTDLPWYCIIYGLQSTQLTVYSLEKNNGTLLSTVNSLHFTRLSWYCIFYSLQYSTVYRFILILYS